MLKPGWKLRFWAMRQLLENQESRPVLLDGIVASVEPDGYKTECGELVPFGSECLPF